ncbi:DUF4175 family protein [Brevifollis gellanilyticus]|uniref:Methyl-accepting transducer domain-containing protein n=1 Tax=Brevifollis gellanilyticus TaxID=748831 RepID=A0A512MG28_9BACT|nr:DUF4175 family protein [Brevifollis gellanilyticus]GEP45700.1 hypothetical protein BGE01nite_49910 [Brevifollis gellanilyticus]
MNVSLRPATLEALAAFRQRRQKLLQWRAYLAWAGIALAALLVIALLDRARLMPEFIRPWLTLSVYAGAAFFAWRVAWRFIGDARGLPGAARLLEAAAPNMHERLIAAVELSEGHSNESEEFRARLQDEVASEVKNISLDSALPSRSLKPWILGAGGAFFLIIGLCLVSSLHLPGFLARAAFPFVNFARPSSVQINIVAPKPASMLVPIASELEILADVVGPQPERVQIETVSGDSKPRLQDMTRAGSQYQALVSIGQSDLRYRIVAEDAMSPWHTLSARPRPRVTEFVKTIVPPAYSGLPEVKLTEDHGDVEALEGSTLKLSLKANQPVTKAELLLNPDHADHPPAVPVKEIKDGTIHAELLVKPEVESWQIALTAEETGFTNEEFSPWSVTVLPDLPPFVQVIEPAEQLEMLPDESIRFSGAATDDVGLASVKLAHQINAGNWTEKELSGKTGKESQVQATLPLSPLQVKAGDTVMLKLIAIDLKGLKTESEPVRIVILEQTMSPQKREWAAQTRRFAQQAESLSEDARELRKATEQLRRTEKQAEKNPDAARAAQDAVARAQGDLEKVQEKAEDLWKQLQESARQAPTHLDAAEVQLLGERLAHMRQDSLKQMEKEMSGDIEQTESIKHAASEAQSDIDTIASAARAFAAEDNARLVSQQAQQLARQEALLTEQSLPANRDAAQRPKWQEQQRGALAAAEPLREQMEELKPLVDGGQQNQLKEFQKQLTEASADLAASLDKPDQAKSPEHLYGAADNLRQRLARTSDAARAMAEQAANRAQQLREQIARQENPAVVALNEAREAVAQAAAEAKKPNQKPREDRNGDTAQEKAAKELANAAKQLEEQAALREQNALTNDEAALDANRASRAADKLAREVQEATTPEGARAMPQPAGKEDNKNNTPDPLVAKAEQLRDAVRALEADALAQTAMKAAEEAAFSATQQPNENPAADQARAAAEALRQLPENIRRMKQPDAQKAQAAQQLAQKAQQAADQNRNAAEQLQNLERQAATQPPNQPLNTQPAQQAAEQARQQASEVAQQLAEQTGEAREALAQLTPKVSDMMKAVAQDLKQTQQETQAAAAEAQANKPVADVAQKASELQTQSEENAEKMASVQAALRQEANAADLQKQSQRQMARTADAALAQMQQAQPQVEQNLKQASEAQQSQPQAQALNQAAQAQQQAAQALDQLAKNMAKAEAGQELSAQELADAAKMEQDIGVKEPLDEAYARAQALAQMAQDAQQDPGKVLAELEKELPKNAAMQKALAELGKQTAKASEQAVASEAQQPSNLGLATEQAANDLQRVARHQERLGQKEAAQQTAQAAQSLQKQASAARTSPAAPGQPAPPTPKPVGQEALSPAGQATKAAEATAAATPPAMTPHPLEAVQATFLAQALDQLDAQLHPMQAQNGQPQPGGEQQQQGQQGQQQAQKPGAQQSLSQAQQSQQQQMADQRNQGQTPGTQQPKPSSQMAQNQQNQKQQQNQSQASTENADGDIQAMLKDGVLGKEIILVKGDWGHLPSKMAEDLTEATRTEAAPEYRAAIESYYKAIATKARK